MNNWPKYTEPEQFYGKFKLGADGYPTEAWKKEFLTRIKPPYPMILAWDTTKQVKNITCHKKISESLSRILQQIKDRCHLYDGGAKMISPVAVDIFRLEGWKWDGDFINPDAMHFEATT